MMVVGAVSGSGILFPFGSSWVYIYKPTTELKQILQDGDTALKAFFFIEKK